MIRRPPRSTLLPCTTLYRSVDQPSTEETVQILKGLRDRYEAHHKVNITDEALEAAAELADRYISDRFLPDKAIDLIDEAASRIDRKSTRLNSSHANISYAVF